jgi:acetyltransferase-like isoleucine patch superfamily enzyme
MNRLIKKLLSISASPLIRALTPLAEQLQRVAAWTLLCARVPGLDPSVVVLGALEIQGTGRLCFGRNLRLYRDLYLETQEAGEIEISDGVVISRGVHIVAYAGIVIGEGSMIGEYTSIRDQNHVRSTSGAIRETGHNAVPIIIGREVWIGRGVTILPGVHIGDRATVGANAVVTRDVAAGDCVAGVPARSILTLTSPDKREEEQVRLRRDWSAKRA